MIIIKFIKSNKISYDYNKVLSSKNMIKIKRLEFLKFLLLAFKYNYIA
jgi:hypothetical protein